jgi:hypothetical protein
MTELEKKTIQHCINTLQKIDTFSIYLHVREFTNSPDALRALQDAGNVHVNAFKNDAIEWLKALTEEN